MRTELAPMNTPSIDPSKRRVLRNFAAALAFALVLAASSRAHAFECAKSWGDPSVTDTCRVLVVSAEAKAELETKPHATLLVGMEAPTKLDLESLANVPWLEQLEIEDLSGLVAHDALVDLVVCVTPAQANVVGTLTSLKKLDIAGLESLAALSKLTKLTYLHATMPSTPKPKSTSALASLTAMRTLRINAFDLADLDGLDAMKTLESLDVSGSKVSSLAPLAGATTLRELYVWGTNVSSLAPLEKLTGLETVDVRDTKVTHFSPLMKSAKSLRHLYVSAGTPKSAFVALSKENPKLDVSTP